MTLIMIGGLWKLRLAKKIANVINLDQQEVLQKAACESEKPVSLYEI